MMSSSRRKLATTVLNSERLARRAEDSAALPCAAAGRFTNATKLPPLRLGNGFPTPSAGRALRLALSYCSPHAGSSPRHHRLSTRAGNQNNDDELETLPDAHAENFMATRLLRSSPARFSRSSGEDELRADESRAQRFVRTG